MWVWSLNWNPITPRIVLGTCPMAVPDLERIHTEAAATALLSLQHDECLERLAIDYPALVRHARATRLALERCPIRDFDSADMRRRLPDAVRALHRLLAQGHRVYVHCTAGMGRAPLTVAGHLSLVGGVPPEDALALLRARRACVVPSREALDGARRDLVARHREVIEERARRYGAARAARWWRGSDPARLRAECEVLREVLTEVSCAFGAARTGM
jgi:hypothetical protein